MPHADSSFVPRDITTKAQFYAHVHEQLEHLLDGSRYWLSNLAQVSSLLYHAYLSSALYGSNQSSVYSPTVNWVGFYLVSLPFSSVSSDASITASSSSRLLLGPYNGRPACISINPVKGKGVCADAFVTERGVVVPDVEAYPGHIACDGDTQSEIVLPLTIARPDGKSRTIGVLDLDSTKFGTFDDEDLKGLQGIVELVAKASDWP